MFAYCRAIVIYIYIVSSRIEYVHNAKVYIVTVILVDIFTKGAISSLFCMVSPAATLCTAICSTEFTRNFFTIKSWVTLLFVSQYT